MGLDVNFKYERLNGWRVAVCDSDLHKTTKCILLIMSIKWMNEFLYCFPSQRTMAEVVGCTPNTVNKHLKLAAKKGWLVPESTTGRKQGWKRNDYYAFIPAQKNE